MGCLEESWKINIRSNFDHQTLGLENIEEPQKSQNLRTARSWTNPLRMQLRNILFKKGKHCRKPHNQTVTISKIVFVTTDCAKKNNYIVKV